ncbi:Hypothetical protein LUCI_4441 [Lucifera butyrica]|uniref:Uncharacterized protein n=1 Tax=Lucifera butyrica TaxID=1351585 RepID=A0A498RDU0_9FIRM|nr:hypothetical protein [Lucifera butyrica]VBB09155.1 Hypothetical protein LUCI_4441 [Lucifera butyrica]
MDPLSSVSTTTTPIPTYTPIVNSSQESATTSLTSNEATDSTPVLTTESASSSLSGTSAQGLIAVDDVSDTSSDTDDVVSFADKLKDTINQIEQNGMTAYDYITSAAGEMTTKTGVALGFSVAYYMNATKNGMSPDAALGLSIYTGAKILESFDDLSLSSGKTWTILSNFEDFLKSFNLTKETLTNFFNSN